MGELNFVDGHLMTVDIRHGANRVVTDEPAHNSIETPLTIKTNLHLNEGMPGAAQPTEAEEIYSPEPV